MGHFVQKHKKHWLNRAFLFSALSGFLLLSLGLLLNYGTTVYASHAASNAVTDVFLDNLPVVNVDFVFVDGAILFWIFAIAILVYEPRRIPFIIKSIALFIIVRSFFVGLTHIGASPQQIPMDLSNWIEKITFGGGDLFFSGHTGLPFLLALIFWKNRILRIIFLLSSVMFGAITLLGHIHYSIDVFAAFFITYTIFHLAQKLFAKDYKTFTFGLEKT